MTGNVSDPLCNSLLSLFAKRDSHDEKLNISVACFMWNVNYNWLAYRTKKVKQSIDIGQVRRCWTVHAVRLSRFSFLTGLVWLELEEIWSDLNKSLPTLTLRHETGTFADNSTPITSRVFWSSSSPSSSFPSLLNGGGKFNFASCTQLLGATVSKVPQLA